jgi:hypothetical protein
MNGDSVMKTFHKEYELFSVMLKDKTPFALARFADGEWGIMNSKKTGNREFQYDPEDQSKVNIWSMLWEAYRYIADGYFIGISCPCCGGEDLHFDMIKASGRTDFQLPDVTYSNVFVNKNYDHVEHLIALFKAYPTYIVASSDITANKLGSNWMYYPVGKSAFNQYEYIRNQLIPLVENVNHEHRLFLFACGPLGSVMPSILHKINPRHTYIDIGSILDPFVGLGATRSYHDSEHRNRQKTCVWSHESQISRILMEPSREPRSLGSFTHMKIELDRDEDSPKKVDPIAIEELPDLSEKSSSAAAEVISRDCCQVCRYYGYVAKVSRTYSYCLNQNFNLFDISDVYTESWCCNQFVRRR